MPRKKPEVTATPTEAASGDGCIKLLSLLVFTWGALMMYPKTVDLLSKFAPNEFMGYTDLGQWWAMGSALLIEGVIVIWKIKMWIFPARNLVEWAADIVLTFTPFALSAIAQVFDSMINRDTLAQQPAEVQMFVTWGVPLLPSIMVALLLFYSIIESAPNGLFGSTFSTGQGKPWKFPDLFGMFRGMNVPNAVRDVPGIIPNADTKNKVKGQPKPNAPQPEPEPVNPTPASTD